jgi:hypothetical protein
MKGIRKMCLPLIELHFPALLNFWSPFKKNKMAPEALQLGTGPFQAHKGLCNMEMKCLLVSML